MDSKHPSGANALIMSLPIQAVASTASTSLPGL